MMSFEYFVKRSMVRLEGETLASYGTVNYC